MRGLFFYESRCVQHVNSLLTFTVVKNTEAEYPQTCRVRRPYF